MLRVPENVYEITTNASYIVSLEQGYSHMKKNIVKRGKYFTQILTGYVIKKINCDYDEYLSQHAQ